MSVTRSLGLNAHVVSRPNKRSIWRNINVAKVAVDFVDLILDFSSVKFVYCILLYTVSIRQAPGDCENVINLI